MTNAKPLCRVLWNLIALVILAQALSACSTVRYVTIPCPEPPAAARKVGSQLPLITGSSLPQQTHVEITLDAIAKYNQERESHAQLDAWGVAHCKWAPLKPSPVPATEEASAVAAVP